MDGFVVSNKAGLFWAKHFLKNKKEGTILGLKFYNGCDYFVKENGKIRFSTIKEFKILKRLFESGKRRFNLSHIKNNGDVS